MLSTLVHSVDIRWAGLDSLFWLIPSGETDNLRNGSYISRDFGWQAWYLLEGTDLQMVISI